MPLCEARSTNDRHGHVAERFQQPFRRGLAGATCGVTSEQTGEFPVLLTQTVADDPFQQRQNAQGDGEHAHHSHLMIITLHVQRSQGQPCETSNGAFSQRVVAGSFSGLFQGELAYA